MNCIEDTRKTFVRGPMVIIGVINAKHVGAENASYAIKASYLKNLIELLPNPPRLQNNSMIGVNRAFTFKGFCNYHDNSLFKDIEKDSFNLNNYHHQLLFAYRTSVNESRKKEVLIDAYDSFLRDPEVQIPECHIRIAIYGLRMGIKDGEFTRKMLLTL